MAYCLNPDCPHKKKIGRPAEFREGITHCSDCGSLLSEEVIEKEDIQKAPPRRIIPTNLYKRILYTIGFVLLWRALLFIPAPGIDLHALGSFFNHVSPNSLFIFFGLPFDRVSILSLGIMPYLSTYMIVEILSMFIQPLKAWRAEGYWGRIKIKKVALFATLLFALFQGYMIGLGFEKMTGLPGENIIRHPGLSFRLVLAITLAAGTFLTIWIAGLITKKGIGHGISILILAGFGRSILSNISMIISVPHERSLLEYFLLFTLIVTALLFIIVLMEKTKRKIPVRFNDGIEAYIPLKLTSAGIMPAEWTSTLIMLPTTVLLLIKNLAHPNWELPESLMPPGIWYYVIYFMITIFLYYLFTSFFYDPQKIVTFLKSRQASIVFPPGKKEESYIDRSLEALIPVAVVYLCFLVFVPQVTSRLPGFYLGGVTLIITVAILLDLTEEIRTRSKETNLIKVAELHDVPMAGLVKSLLEQKGLPCYLRGYYHRALLYFFGPYIEISVLVPEDRVTDATEVIENYLDANILTVQTSRVSEFP
jgi:preprotein translocase subunit SecY